MRHLFGTLHTEETSYCDITQHATFLLPHADSSVLMELPLLLCFLLLPKHWCWLSVAIQDNILKAKGQVTKADFGKFGQGTKKFAPVSLPIFTHVVCRDRSGR